MFVSAFCFALLPIFGKYAYSLGITPLNLLAWRFIVAAAALWLTVPFLVGRKLKVRAIDLLHFVLQGIIGYGLASIGYFNALTYMDASLVSILFYTYPVLVTILSRLIFREKLSPLRWLIIAMTFVGSFLVTNLLQTTLGQVPWKGVLFGLQAALAYSVFNIYSQKTTARTQPLVVSTYAVSSMAVFFVLIVPKHELLNINMPLLVISLIIGLVSTIIPIITYLTGIKHIGASRAAVISTFEPVFTLILAFFILGDHLTFSQTIGAALIFAGILVLQLERKPNPQLEQGDSSSVLATRTRGRF